MPRTDPLTLSELIAQLQTLQKMHGDKPAVVSFPGWRDRSIVGAAEMFNSVRLQAYPAVRDYSQKLDPVPPPVGTSVEDLL